MTPASFRRYVATHQPEEARHSLDPHPPSPGEQAQIDYGNAKDHRNLPRLDH